MGRKRRKKTGVCFRDDAVAAWRAARATPEPAPKTGNVYWFKGACDVCADGVERDVTYARLEDNCLYPVLASEHPDCQVCVECHDSKDGVERARAFLESKGRG